MGLRDRTTPSHPARILYRKLAARVRVTRALRNSELPSHAIYFEQGGLGDDLIGTALARPLAAATGRPVWVLSRHPELFLHEKSVASVLPPTIETALELSRRGAKVLRTGYTENLNGGALHASPREHIIAAMARRAALSGLDVPLRPYVTLTEQERASARVHGEKLIAIQSSGRAARFAIPTKEWFPERFTDVVAHLSGSHRVVQIGSAADPLIPGAVDLRGKTTLRETAALLAHATLFVGLVGFLMHLARAVERRSVIIFGGREAPWQSGYCCNENVYRALPCSPCWLVEGCPYDMSCMREISASDVVAAVNQALQCQDKVLQTDVVSF